VRAQQGHGERRCSAGSVGRWAATRATGLHTAAASSSTRRNGPRQAKAPTSQPGCHHGPHARGSGAGGRCRTVECGFAVLSALPGAVGAGASHERGRAAGKRQTRDDVSGGFKMTSGAGTRGEAAYRASAALCGEEAEPRAPPARAAPQPSSRAR